MTVVLASSVALVGGCGLVALVPTVTLPTVVTFGDVTFAAGTGDGSVSTSTSTSTSSATAGSGEGSGSGSGRDVPARGACLSALGALSSTGGSMSTGCSNRIAMEGPNTWPDL